MMFSMAFIRRQYQIHPEFANDPLLRQEHSVARIIEVMNQRNATRAAATQATTSQATTSQKEIDNVRKEKNLSLGEQRIQQVIQQKATENKISASVNGPSMITGQQFSPASSVSHLS